MSLTTSTGSSEDRVFGTNRDFNSVCIQISEAKFVKTSPNLGSTTGH